MSSLNKMLNLHSGGDLIKRNNLQWTPTPAAEARWTPIPHHQLLNTVLSSLVASGLQVEEELHALARNGTHYFGVLKLETPRTDYRMVLGLRNTHDKTFGASIAIGSEVFVCSNLAFSGAIKLSRKHTLNIVRDLPALAHKALGQFKVQQRLLSDRYDTYKATEVDQFVVDHAIMDMVRGRIVMPSQVGHVAKEWAQPSFEDHEEYGDSAWKLFNAVTHVMKGTPFFTLPQRTAGLHNVIDGICERVN